MFPPHTEHRMSYTYLCVHSCLLQSDMYILHPLSSSQTLVYRLLLHSTSVPLLLHRNIQQPLHFLCYLSSSCLHSKSEGRVMCSHHRSIGSDRNSNCLLEVLLYLRYQNKSSSATAMKLLLPVPYHLLVSVHQGSRIQSIHTRRLQSLL